MSRCLVGEPGANERLDFLSGLRELWRIVVTVRIHVGAVSCAVYKYGLGIFVRRRRVEAKCVPNVLFFIKSTQLRQLLFRTTTKK